MKSHLGKFIFGLAAAVALCGVSVDQASAFGHHRGYGSCGSSGSSGSWGSSGGSWGGHSVHRAYVYGGSRGSLGSYGGSSGSSGGWSYSYYCSGGSSGGWGVYGSSGSSGGAYVVPATPVNPATPATPSTPTAPKGTTPSSTSPASPGPLSPGVDLPKSGPASLPAIPPTSSGVDRAGAATIAVSVPADAQIFINGRATTTQGEDRRYLSAGLAPGYTYSYEVKAQFTQNGKPVEQTKTVRLIAGQVASVDFRAEVAPVVPVSAETVSAARPVETVLTVHVPENAKVFLAGQETDMIGGKRVFTTTKLPAGEQWTNYTIRAVLMQDGKEVVKEQTITLAAGENRVVSFSFQDGKVAAAAASATR